MTKPGEFVPEYIVTAADMNGLWPDWEPWTPTYVNLTVGDGTVVARYVAIGPTIHVYYSLTLGSTSSIAGGPRISVPVAPATSYADGDVLGKASYLDSGTAQYWGRIRFDDSLTDFLPVEANLSGSLLIDANIGSASPFTWATNDVLQFAVTYEAA